MRAAAHAGGGEGRIEDVAAVPPARHAAVDDQFADDVLGLRGAVGDILARCRGRLQAVAQVLYNKVAERSGFIVYRKPL